MSKDLYRTVFLKKCKPHVTQFMLDQNYPFFSEVNGLSFLKLNLSKYICLDDLIYGKQNQLIEIYNEGLIFIFQQLYFLIKHLNDNNLQYFKIEKQHIWINIDVNEIIGLTLSHPQMEFESNFESKKFKKHLFIQLYDLLEQHKLNSKQSEIITQCLNSDMNIAGKIEIDSEEVFICQAKELFYNLENSMKESKERVNEINCNTIEFKYILDNIPYYFYKANLHKKFPNELIEKIINSLNDIKTLCKRYDGYKSLGEFIIQEEIIIKLNDQDYLLDGRLKQEYKQYLEHQGSTKKSLNFTQMLLGQISGIINIDEQQILEILNELDGDFEKISQEQQQQILERIQQNINFYVRKRLQELE